MTEQHTVKSYDEELARLTAIIIQMGRKAQAQLDDALHALVHRDSDLASAVVAADIKIDELEQEVQSLTVRMLALRQPMADDLRRIVTSLKICSELERIADYAANLAKRTLVLNHLPPVRTVQAVLTMAHAVQTLLKDIVDAYVDQDVAKAMDVWLRDEEVDAMYTGLFRELITYMMEDARTITACTHLMFMAKNIERMGDHATNMAECLYFLVHGSPIAADRPKVQGG